MRPAEAGIRERLPPGPSLELLGPGTGSPTGASNQPSALSAGSQKLPSIPSRSDGSAGEFLHDDDASAPSSTPGGPRRSRSAGLGSSKYGAQSLGQPARLTPGSRCADGGGLPLTLEAGEPGGARRGARGGSLPGSYCLLLSPSPDSDRPRLSGTGNRQLSVRFRIFKIHSRPLCPHSQLLQSMPLTRAARPCALASASLPHRTSVRDPITSS